MTSFEKVAVLGLGTMGAGIAQLVAQSGRDVIAVETDQSRLDVGMGAIDAFLAEGVQRGKVTAATKEEVLDRVIGTTSLSDIAEAALIIEAVTERRDVKRALLADAAALVAPDAVILTNTSALSVSDLATSVSDPGRFAGLHFFNPPQLMSVIEVVAAQETRREVVKDLVAFVRELGKDPIEVKDRPGFLINRLLMPYLNDVIQAFDDELATAEDLDTAMRLGLGYKLGPLELLDMIGLDVHDHATRSAYNSTLDPAFAPPPLLQAMVAAGSYGKKSGRGFRTGEDKK